jgi:uncharacterized membrane protein
MRRAEWDLNLIVVTSLLVVAITLAAPYALVVRIALGLPFLLVFPGYAIIAAMFPRKSDLEPIERVALGLAVSVATVPLIGLALNYSPWGITTGPVLASVTTLIIAGAATASHRRRRVPAEEAFCPRVRMGLPAIVKPREISVPLVAVWAVLLIVAGGTAYYLADGSGEPPRFTEFYVLATDGRAIGYPSYLAPREVAAVTLGVVNREGRAARYEIVVKVDGETMDSVGDIVLDAGSRWEGVLTLLPTHGGVGQKVEYLLYKDGQAAPHRSLHLWVDIPVPLAETARPEEAASPSIGMATGSAP